VVYVTADLGQNSSGEGPPVPPLQEFREPWAILAPRARDQDDTDGFLQLVPRTRDERLRFAQRQIQHYREVRVAEVVPQAELDDLASPQIQPGKCRLDQLPQLCMLGSAAIAGPASCLASHSHTRRTWISRPPVS
jgi:hypothetical protein